MGFIDSGLILTCLRVFIILGSNISVFIFLLTLIFKRRRSYALPVTYAILKVFCIDILFGHILPVYFGGEPFFSTAKAMTVFCFSLSAYFVFYFFLEADFLRVAIVCMLCELISTFTGYFSLGTVNYIEGRESIWEIGAASFFDFLYPVISVAILSFFLFFTKRWLLKLRYCRLPCPPLLWILYVGYLSGAAGSLFTSFDDYSEVTFYTLFVYITVLLLAVLLVFRYSSAVRRRKAFLSVRMKLAMDHYVTACGQSRVIGRELGMIDAQMEKIVLTESVSDDEVISRYIKKLRENYEKISAGIYCGDPVLDAVVCQGVSLYRQRGIDFYCYMQEYDRGDITEDDIVGIFMILTELGMGGTKVELRAAAVKNKLVIKFISEGGRKKRKIPGELYSIIKKYDGSIDVISRNGGINAVIVLERGA